MSFVRHTLILLKKTIRKIQQLLYGKSFDVEISNNILSQAVKKERTFTMTNIGKSFLTAIITFLAKEILLWIFNFDPINDFPKYYGFVIDISIWLVLFYVILWFIGKIGAANVKIK